MRLTMQHPADHDRLMIRLRADGAFIGDLVFANPAARDRVADALSSVVEVSDEPVVIPDIVHAYRDA